MILLDRVSGQFLAGVSLQRILLKEAFLESQDWDSQLTFLTSTLLHPVILKHPLKWSYQIAFIKKCISELEALAVDIRDEFYELLVSLQSKQTSWPQKWVFRHYLLLSGDIVTITEAPQIISEGTTGLSCWQAGIFLADWMSQNAMLFFDKRILELGSGTGATGLIISRSCKPQELVLSDCHENVLRLLRDNVELNKCREGASSVRVIDLNWDDVSQLTFSPEVILAADVVYDDTIFRPLVDLLLTLCRRNRSLQVYLAATVRNEETLGAFLTMVGESGLMTEVVCSSKDVTNLLNWDDQTEIKLFTIKGGSIDG